MEHSPRWNLSGGMLAWLVLALSLGSVSVADDPPSSPHPVVAWAAGPFEIRVVFNRPLDPSVANTAVGRLIPFEEEISVLRQAKPRRPSRIEPAAALRGTLRIVAARLDGDGRSLLLITDPHPRAATYSLHLTGIRAPGQPAPGEAIDLLYGLGGVKADWDDGGGDAAKPAWSGWWPDLDPGNVRRMTQGSVEHERTLALLSRPGRLVLRTLVVLPKGRFTLRLVSNGPIAAVIGGSRAVAADEPQGGQKVDHPIDSTGAPIDLTVTLRTGLGRRPSTFRASYLNKIEENPRDVRLDHARLLVPWATITPPLPNEPPRLPQGMAGGDPGEGQSIFFGARARCSVCHAIGGKGGSVGPDLGHQFERPPAEVYRDLADPAAWINPNYVAFTVTLKGGRTLVGIVRAEGADAIRITDKDARSTVVRRDQIEGFRPSTTSIMPVGLPGSLGDGPLRDLLAFLTQPPSSAPR